MEQVGEGLYWWMDEWQQSVTDDTGPRWKDFPPDYHKTKKLLYKCNICLFFWTSMWIYLGRFTDSSKAPLEFEWGSATCGWRLWSCFEKNKTKTKCGCIPMWVRFRQVKNEWKGWGQKHLQTKEDEHHWDFAAYTLGYTVQ